MLLFVSLWTILPAFGSPNTCPPPINFTCDITAVDKDSFRKSSHNYVLSKIEMLATIYI